MLCAMLAQRNSFDDETFWTEERGAYMLWGMICNDLEFNKSLYIAWLSESRLKTCCMQCLILPSAPLFFKQDVGLLTQLIN